MRYQMLRVISGVCLLVGLSGCGVGSGIETGEISGTVTYNGQPVTEGVVIFIPSGEGYAAEATIGEDGYYRVQTQDGGLPVGEYQVTLMPPTIHVPDTADHPGGDEIKKVDNIPSKYRSAQTSELRITVQSGSQNFDIAMQE